MKVSAQDLTNYRRKTSVHPWHLQYAPQCIVPSCQTKTYFDGVTHYSLCLSCLKAKKLGPYKGRVHKTDDYSTLFWVGDYERKQERKLQWLNNRNKKRF